MRRIDFLGANGIGKSTVYAHLLERRSDGTPSWLTLIEAKRKVAVEHFLRQRSAMNMAKAATCYLPKMGDVFAEAYTIRSAERAFAERGERYQSFFEHCIEHLMGVAQPSPQHTPLQIGGANSGAGASPLGSGMMSAVNRHILRAPGPLNTPPVRTQVHKGATPVQYLSLSRIFGRLKELCLLESLDATVIFDESLSHAVARMLADTPSELSVRAHFEEVPPPDGLIHMTASEDEVLRRLSIKQKRRGPIVRHRGLDEEQLRRQVRRTLRITEIGASTLQWRGAEVLYLDATAAPEVNAERIEQFISR